MRVEHLGRSCRILADYQHEPVLVGVNDVNSNGEHGPTSDKSVDFVDRRHSDNRADHDFDRRVCSAQASAPVKRWSAAQRRLEPINRSGRAVQRPRSQ
jgi:hypothetical protein